MIEMNTWIPQFLQALDAHFPERVWFAGLQGSYARGEATETSDLDMVVILDELSASDIHTYNRMLDTLPHRQLLCGFLSGKRELLNWAPSDLFQLYHDTRPLLGSLDDLLPLMDEETVKRAIRFGACNIYHGCVHNMLYGKSETSLRGLYKSAFFVVQAICFRQTGTYVRSQKELLLAVAAPDRVIVENFLALKQGGRVEFQKMSEELFAWAQNRIG